MTLREAREAAARKWLVAHYAALRDGPGIPQAVISDLADFAAVPDLARCRYEVGGVFYEAADVRIIWPGDELAATPPAATAAAPARPAPRRRTARKDGAT